MGRRAVFLDRDGTLNGMVHDPEHGTVDSPMRPEDLELLPGAAEAVRGLNELGLLVFVVSNQPAVAKGKTSEEHLEAMSSKLLGEVSAAGGRIDGVYYCLHHPEAMVRAYRDVCACRKPEPGLILRAAREHDVDLAGSFVVGDSVTDVLAGQRAGCMTILLASRALYVADALRRAGGRADHVVATLPDAVDALRRILADKERADRVTYAQEYLEQGAEIIRALDVDEIERMVGLLTDLRERGGRLFVIGVGGGAAHASHAVSDFRKIAGLEAYSPMDNVAELTARINDDGWEDATVAWLQGSRLRAGDAVLVFSVGGGDPERGVSVNLVRALELARELGATILGVVGRDGGYTAKVADCCVIVPVVDPATVTAHTEAFQAVIWHLLVSHPRLRAHEMKWESMGGDSR